MGNLVYKQSYDGSTTTRKYIVDISGKFPTILCELDGSSLTKSYIYSSKAQILAQRVHTDPADVWTYDNYFYVSDRLGSVRQVVDSTGDIVLHYTYSPFGQLLESGSSTEPQAPSNCFKFTGQWYDSEISQYYLRARMYDPYMARFTGRDPVSGKYNRPRTFHEYLYCLNDPVNKIDPDGKFFGLAALLFSSAMDAQLRKMDIKFHKDLFDKCMGVIDAFSLVNLQRGAMFDMFIAKATGGFSDSLKDAGIEAISLVSPNAGKLLSVTNEIADKEKRDEIRDVIFGKTQFDDFVGENILESFLEEFLGMM